MSNVAQTWTIIGATVALVSLIVTLLSFWIAHSLAALRGELAAMRSDVREGFRDVRDEMRGGFRGVQEELRELRTEVLRDHSERITKLEERIAR
jgi:hypothetical protein